MLFGPDGSVVGHHRKIHLPGYHDVKPDHPFQNLEKRSFEVGDLGLQGVERIGGSRIIAPSDELVAVASSDGDEIVVAEVDLVAARRYERRLLDLRNNRQPHVYGAITEVTAGPR